MSKINDIINQHIGRKSLIYRQQLKNHVKTIFESGLESPIEALMLAHLYTQDWVYWPEVYYPDPAFNKRFPDTESLERYHLKTGDLCVWRQYPVEGYRLDFAIVVPCTIRRKCLKIAVECDGHEFHERTREQASHDKKRDRALQKMDWVVFRYTGTDINQHGDDCAREINQFVSEWYNKAVLERVDDRVDKIA